MAQAATAELDPTIINKQLDHPLEFNTHESCTQILRDELIRKTKLQDELICKVKLQELQNKRKLCLVLDLDNTLVHSKKVRKFSQDEKDRFLNQSVSQDIIRWNLPIYRSDKRVKEIKYVTKLRPFVRKFLEEANNLFQMCIFTLASREYAFSIAKILDPDREYFGSRIFARDNCKEKGQKGLDVVKVQESGVIILDDTESVWQKHERNLTVMNRYNYFADKESCTRSFSEDGFDEFEIMGALSCLLQRLKEVHRLYFEKDTCLDVRELLDTVRKEFVTPGKNVTIPALAISAEQMGAVCLDEYSNASAMRTVCSDAYTSEAKLAMMDNKVLECTEERKQPDKELAVCLSSDSGSRKRERSDSGEDSLEASAKKPKC